MSRLFVFGLTATLLFAMLGCKKTDELQPFQPASEPDYGRELPPGQMALRKIPLEQYPDFSKAFYDRGRLEEAIRNSIGYMQKPSSRKFYPYLDISHERALASLESFLHLLSIAGSPRELNAVIRRDYEVYESVGWDFKGTVFFTGYYTPIFDGRRQREGPYQYPLYKTPPDLVRDADGNVLGRKTPDGRIVPYYTRREIESQGLLDGTEIAWLKDPFEAYVAGVQGSAKIRLADGSMLELGYGGTNGAEYVSIARRMIADGVLSRKQLSLQAMIAYFRQHPDQVRKYTWQNPRFAFFQERSGGPFGSINVPVIPYYSIATDKSVFPRACLAYVETQLPKAAGGQVRPMPYASFALDQDTGGAIRAAGRSDIYMGIGPDAEAIAGRVGSEGRLYYLFLRPAAGAGANR